MTVGATVRLGVTMAEAAAASLTALDRAIPGRALLEVDALTGEGVFLGAFQRPSEVGVKCTLLRRISGGGPVRGGTGTVHVRLLLAHPAALTPCDPSQVVNRYVRPLLKALTRSGALAHNFGRDWVSVGHRPMAAVSLAHDAATGRAVFEAFVAVRTPFAVADRASFLGKAPITMEDALGKPVDVGALVARIVEAYGEAYGGVTEGVAAPSEAPRALTGDDDPPWAATVQVPIGLLGAGPDGRGRLRVGGEIVASRDALVRLEATLADVLEGGARSPSSAQREAVAAALDGALAAPGVALLGLRSLAPLVDLVLAAAAGWTQQPAPEPG